MTVRTCPIIYFKGLFKERATAGEIIPSWPIQTVGNGLLPRRTPPTPAAVRGRGAHTPGQPESDFTAGPSPIRARGPGPPDAGWRRVTGDPSGSAGPRPARARRLCC